MTQSGARGPASPPKPPAAPAAKVGSPAAPPVAPRTGVAPRAPGQVGPATQALPAKPVGAGLAPMRPKAPSAPLLEDDWDGDTTTDQRPAAALPKQEVTLTAPWAPPVAPAAMAPPTPQPQVQATPPAGPSTADVLLLVRELVEHATEPLKARIAELERRLAAQAAAASMGMTPTPAITGAVRPGQSAPPPPMPTAQHALSAPPASVQIAPRAPLLDVAAIEREVALDPDMRGFDGRGRRRRMMILFVVSLVVVFGGLFAMLADSYSPHN